jgi:hypothetical protein
MKTGNVKQVANYEQLVSTATAYGTGYNPAKGSMKLPALNALLTQAHQSLQNVSSAENNYMKAVSARVTAFDGIEKLTTRMVNAFASTEATAELVEDAMMIRQRMRGGKPFRSSAERLKSHDNTGAVNAKEDPPALRSHGSHDFSNKAMLFGKLLGLIASEPMYKPNEPDLTIAALTAYHTSLHNSNSAVARATSTLQMARTNRDAILYKDGIYKTAKSVKRYVKSVYGAKSEQFASIGGLEFRGK